MCFCDKDCPWCAFKKSANTTHFGEKSEVRDNFADWLSGRLKRYYAGEITEGELEGQIHDRLVKPMWDAIEQGQEYMTMGSCCCSAHPPDRTFLCELTLMAHGHKLRRIDGSKKCCEWDTNNDGNCPRHPEQSVIATLPRAGEGAEMGEARRRKFAKCLFSSTGMCSMPSQFPWKHVYSNVCICAACEQVRQEEANRAWEARTASARLFRDHPFKMDEPNVLDTRESSSNEGQVVPVPGTKPSPNRRPALAFSLLAVALALNVPMGAELAEENINPRRRR